MHLRKPRVLTPLRSLRTLGGRPICKLKVPLRHLASIDCCLPCSDVMCKECGRSYKTDGWLREHLVNEHNWEFGGENIDESKPDHIALYRSSLRRVL